MPQFVLLWTDAALWLMAASGLAYGLYARGQPLLAERWRRVFQTPAAMASAVVLAACAMVALLDSVHYRRALPAVLGQGGAGGASEQAPQRVYEARTRSVLDALLAGLEEGREATYSRPLATVSFTKESVVVHGEVVRVAPRLRHGGAHLRDPQQDWALDVAWRLAAGLALGLGAVAAGSAALIVWAARRRQPSWRELVGQAWRGEHGLPLRAAWVTVAVLSVLWGITMTLGGAYHLLGTDQTGHDVLYQALKSIRTAFVIGTLATVATLPLAVGLGIAAGYVGRWVDEAIQYLYTVLSSVPNVLLIAACVLMVQVFLDQHPDLLETGAERADLKLFLLCTVLGLTGWPGLCRLLRAETLKQRELDYVRAARAYGAGPWRLMFRHIAPNTAHLVLIVTVLEFSALVLYEAVLSYVGVGVDPSMNSFGGMINLSRSEMSREPLVWWSFATAFAFMLALVLSANLLADGVQRAFDPRQQPA